MPRKQRGGAPIKDRSFCKGNNYNEDDACFIDPISLECVDDQTYFRTREGHCFNLDSLRPAIRASPKNPMSNRIFSNHVLANLLDEEDLRYHQEVEEPTRIYVAKVRSINGLGKLDKAAAKYVQELFDNALYTAFTDYLLNVSFDYKVFPDAYTQYKARREIPREIYERYNADVALDLDAGLVYLETNAPLDELNLRLETLIGSGDMTDWTEYQRKFYYNYPRYATFAGNFKFRALNAEQDILAAFSKDRRAIKPTFVIGNPKYLSIKTYADAPTITLGKFKHLPLGKEAEALRQLNQSQKRRSQKQQRLSRIYRQQQQQQPPRPPRSVQYKDPHQYLGWF